MSEALVVRDERAVTVTPDQVDLIKKTLAPEATDAELKLFIYDNTRRGINPLDKMIHFTKRKGKYTPLVGIDFMRTRAAESGDYAGSDDAVFEGGERPDSARVTVWRFVQGQRCGFTATARWSEYYPGDGDAGFLWRKMPHTMLAKCAEALALRKGFPQQISGLYTAEEMAQASEDAPPPRVQPIRSATPVVVAQVVASDEPTDLFPDDAQEPEPAAAEPEGYVYITKVTKRNGEKNGKAYSQWFVTTSDGREGSTFDGPTAVSAEAAMASKSPVIATWEQRGKYTNLVNLLRA